MAAATTAYDAVHVLGEAVYWLETRPSEGGRTALVRWTSATGAHDVLPSTFDVGTWVNEYGGGAYLPTGVGLFVCNAVDGRVYRLASEGSLEPVTPDSWDGSIARFADLRLVSSGEAILAVSERGTDQGVVDELVLIPLARDHGLRVVASGHDFLSFPRPSPNGRALAWISADRPRMPWDGSKLWVASFDDTVPGPARAIAGGDSESLFQPEWGPDGELYFVSDRTGWWNLYRVRGGATEVVLPMAAEFGEPQWEFDYSTYAFLDSRQMVCRLRDGGRDRLAILDVTSSELEELALPFTSVKPYVRATAPRIVFIGSSATAAPAVMAVELPNRESITLAQPESLLDSRYVSEPEHLQVPAGDGVVHALYYPPRNPDVTPPHGELAPLIVQPHPGPTFDAKPRLDLRLQYFTSRGFGVVAVNYRGSTGFGRAYREALVGRWGEADVEDSIAVARHLIETRRADPRRVVISGASAGGFTALNAAASRNLFSAAVSTSGITDLEMHRVESPRFQAYKLDRLVGPYPEGAEEYRRRSPVNKASHMRCPVLLMHGLDDTVVPPVHSRKMAGALERAGVPYAHLEFDGTGHTFTSGQAIRLALESELAFYASTLGLTLADRIEPVQLRH